MNKTPISFPRSASYLAINLVYLMIWGFAGIGKVVSGVPQYFHDKFAKTWLASFPGIAASFWLITASELAAFGLALAALMRREFWVNRTPSFLVGTLVWSLFVFLQLGFGLWLTGDFSGGYNLFVYFALTVGILHFVETHWQR